MGKELSTPVHARLDALDGLRGLAAVIVVLSHALLATTLGDPYVAELRGTGDGEGLPALIANTPLRYFVMGSEAVVIFFVLSGLVLTLPMLRGRGMDLWAYYPRRVLRLWIPVAGSVILAVVIILFSSQDPTNAPSEWVKKFSFPAVGPREVIESFFMITGSTELNNPLWSLKWEMLFSLFLPLVFLVVTCITRHYWLIISLCGLVSGIGGAIGVSALAYGPMFVAGAAAAKIITTNVIPKTASTSWMLVGGGVLLIGLPDFGRAVLQVSPTFVALLQSSVTIGATMMVLGLTIPSGITSAFGSRPGRFLGRISFSLYLVHAPILIGAVHLAPAHSDAILAASVPVAFVVGWIFMRFVEVPSANLARHVGYRMSSIISRQLPDYASSRPATRPSQSDI